ncbi:COG1361 S-layer family protein [Halopiger goleimassiliensis]|uniref:COG1361 S-layer family protein n=1 Tax=Halopiger goleimassiliensis TaxID=1293048 RepID=UPI0006777A26|nr:COG1361 S-layer family protein [Halopiger goleimassiliensis]
MTGTDRPIGVFVALTLVTTVGLAVGATAVASSQAGELPQGEPDIDAYLTDSQVVPGTEDTLEILLENDGDLQSGMDRQNLLTARAVSVEVVDDGPFDVTSGTTSVGAIPDGQRSEPVTKRLEVPEDVDPGSYEITIEVDYSYTYRISETNRYMQDRSTTEEIDLTVEVPDEPRFEIGDVTTDVEAGGDGPATFEIENVGTEPANQTTATISGNGDVTVNPASGTAAQGSTGGTSEIFLGDLDVGESESVTVEVAISETATTGATPLEVLFEYEDGSGIDGTATSEIASLTPAPEQRFAIDSLEDTLAVGYDGDIVGEITNEGPRPVDDAVLTIEPMSESLFVEDTRYALPELEPGETASFRYPTDVSGQADAGPRQVRFTVEYTNGDGTTLQDGPISERVEVDPQTDEFALAGDVSVEQGERTEFVLEITNQRAETLSNVDAKLYTDDPLETGNDEAFVAELAPGETAELPFDVKADDDAATETHPIELDFEYDTERGETVLSDVYQHPVEVTPGEDDGGSGIIGSLLPWMAVLTASGLGATIWWRSR